MHNSLINQIKDNCENIYTNDKGEKVLIIN
jgi:hypothetical protein